MYCIILIEYYSPALPYSDVCCCSKIVNVPKYRGFELSATKILARIIVAKCNYYSYLYVQPFFLLYYNLQPKILQEK